MASADISIDAILFDAYGTLFDIQGVRAEVAAVAPRPEEFVSGWRRRQLEYSWLRTLMERYVDFAQISADAMDATAAGEGIAIDPAVRTRLLAAWLRPAPYPEVPAALAALEAWPLGILSNGSPSMLATVLDHTQLTDRFTWVLSVDGVRAYKPAPRAYELGVQATGLPRERILFVSSNAWDVAGAAAFGFVTCWVNRSGAAPEALDQVPDLTVPRLDRLPTFLIKR